MSGRKGGTGLGLASAVAAGLFLAAATHGHHGHGGGSLLTDAASMLGSGQSPAPRHAAAAIAYARAQIGKPYAWGATGPAAFDCSGLTQAAEQAAGNRIPRTSQEQWKALPHVSRSQLRAGDLAFYAGSDGTVTAPGHVVLYIGHGKVIQAYGTGVPVEVSSLSSVNAGGLTGYARP